MMLLIPIMFEHAENFERMFYQSQLITSSKQLGDRFFEQGLVARQWMALQCKFYHQHQVIKSIIMKFIWSEWGKSRQKENNMVDSEGTWEIWIISWEQDEWFNFAYGNISHYKT